MSTDTSNGYVTTCGYCGKRTGRIPARQFICHVEQRDIYRAAAQEFEEIRAASTANETCGISAQPQVSNFDHLLAGTKHAAHSGLDQAAE
jgi:hypothetical protein